MRVFEYLYLALLIGSILSSFLRRRILQHFIFYSCILILLLHVLIEGVRWQIYLGYFAFVLCAILFIKQNFIKWQKITLSAFGIISCLFSIALGVAMPVIQFPEPSGSFSIGVESIYLEDKTRKEILTRDNKDYRKLTAHIWYPSYDKIHKPEKYMDNGVAEAFATSKGMPSFIASHFDLTKIHIEHSLPIIKDKKMPVIILSHGLLWNSEMYVSIIEEIVSQGYIVVGIDHLYESFFTTHKGEKIKWNQDNIDRMNVGLDFKYMKSKMDLGLNEKNDKIRTQAIEELIEYLPYFESLDRWSDDISFVIDQILLLNTKPESFLYQKINQEQIGLLGHSWGGAAVVQQSTANPKIKAVINMDGAQWGRASDSILKTPLMLMHADRDYSTFFTPNFYVYHKIAKNDVYLATITSADHANFGDLSYWSKIKSLTQTGTIHEERMSHITNKLILCFFDKYLKGKDVKIQDKFVEQYPEVEINRTIPF
ncbi:alpha/beta hydrolase [Aquimarina algicola]|uniref:Uncharacterized protein n=1 Tax=Aquimarina algicola TaxID=2589995 RepID=A0A504IUJ0_9FLAO|nr:dienelactone hydrolase family protein [Aquimarina algicola]TPN82157.1 hypothetical protein FHK87_22290 [Aquimarina algicola]